MRRSMPYWLLLVGAVFVNQNALGGESMVAEVASMDRLIRNEVETAVSMLQAIEMKRHQGEMSLEQANKLGAYLLRELRYGKDGYFWADTLEGVNVVLYGRKDVEGKNRLEAKDANGVAYIREMIARAKAGGGYLNYAFPKRGEKEPRPKRSYVMLFKPFGWVVGSGYYRSMAK